MGIDNLRSQSAADALFLGYDCQSAASNGRIDAKGLYRLLQSEGIGLQYVFFNGANAGKWGRTVTQMYNVYNSVSKGNGIACEDFRKIQKIQKMLIKKAVTYGEELI